VTTAKGGYLNAALLQVEALKSEVNDYHPPWEPRTQQVGTKVPVTTVEAL